MTVLNLPRLTSPRFLAVHPGTGRPVSFGTVTVYIAGTTTLKNVYGNREGTSALPNPVPLDAAGTADMFQSGPSRIVVKDASGAEVYTADWLNAEEVEIGEDVPDGALLAANNLSDLSSVSAAQAVLGIVKQTGATDATVGSILLNGAHGLGGSIPDITPPDTLATIAVTGWRYASAGNVVALGGPSDVAVDCVCETLYISALLRFQNLYPISSTDWTPYRRAYAGSWSSWVRDAETSGNANGRYVRLANGYQAAWFTGAEMTTTDAVGSIYKSANETWTFPIAFLSAPVVTFGTLRSTDGVPSPWATGANSSVDEITTTQVKATLYGPTSTAAGKVRYTAVGRWK